MSFLAAFDWIILTYFIWNNLKGIYHSKIKIIYLSKCFMNPEWSSFLLYTVYKTHRYSIQSYCSKLLYDFRRLGIWYTSQTLFIMLSWYFCAVWQPLVPIRFHYIEITAWEFLQKILFCSTKVMWKMGLEQNFHLLFYGWTFPCKHLMSFLHHWLLHWLRTFCYKVLFVKLKKESHTCI